MKKFQITVTETIEVEAETEDEAFSKFDDGDGAVIHENTSIMEIVE